MTKKHKDRIRKSYHKLVEELELTSLLSNLHSKEALRYYDMERIRTIREPVSQRAKLLQTITRRHDGAFTDLVNALIEENQRHLAHELDPAGIYLNEGIIHLNIFKQKKNL